MVDILRLNPVERPKVKHEVILDVGNNLIAHVVNENAPVLQSSHEVLGAVGDSMFVFQDAIAVGTINDTYAALENLSCACLQAMASMKQGEMQW